MSSLHFHRVLDLDLVFLMVLAALTTNHLRVLRAERGWSQAQLAGRLKVSRQTINAIETGRSDPSLPLAFAIAGVFGKLIEEIFEPLK